MRINMAEDLSGTFMVSWKLTFFLALFFTTGSTNPLGPNPTYDSSARYTPIRSTDSHPNSVYSAQPSSFRSPMNVEDDAPSHYNARLYERLRELTLQLEAVRSQTPSTVESRDELPVPVTTSHEMQDAPSATSTTVNKSPLYKTPIVDVKSSGYPEIPPFADDLVKGQRPFPPLSILEQFGNVF